MKRVLITGGGGFVGSHVLRHLLINTNWDIVLTDSFRHRGKIDRITEQLSGLNSSRVTVIRHDLTVPISPQMAHKIGNIDYVLNIASESHVDRSIEYPRPFIENNIAVILTMLEYIREYPVRKFIQISTDEVYGPAEGAYKHTEWDPHKPSNPYSASKAAQEDICYAYWRTFNLPIIRTNTMNIIGELQDPEKYIPMIIQRLNQGRPILIHASKEGRVGTRFYLHARNQADALLFLLNKVEPSRYQDGKEMEAYHIVGEREVDNLELAQLVADAMGKPLTYELVDFHSSRPGHDLRYALDGSKMKALRWKPPIDFEKSLRRAVKWTLEHDEWIA